MEEENDKFYNCRYDRPFKEVFLKESNKDLLKELLEQVLRVKINEIEIKPNERNQGNIKVKRKTYDALLTTDYGKIEIEVNASAKEKYVPPRNMAYICDMYSHHTAVGDAYTEDVKIIQINFSYGLGKKNKSKKIYYIQDDDKNKFVKNFEIIEINMDWFMELWYSRNEKELKENDCIVMLGLEEDELEEFSVKSKVIKKYMEEIIEINKDPDFREYMTHEEDQLKIHNSEIKVAREEGESVGFDKGIAQKQQEMVKSLYEQKVSLEVIEKASGLTEKEILEIVKK